ncbi:MAG: SprB repeat-containing protein, partial [Janthinobacterium lividum]
MAGERYAKATIRAAWSWTAYTRGLQTEEIRIKLAGQWEVYRRGGNPANNEFAVPDPSSLPTPRDFVRVGVQNLIQLIMATFARRGLSYTVSSPRDVGDDSSHVGHPFGFYPETEPWPIVEFDIVATVYDAGYDLDFADYSSAVQFGIGGWPAPSLAATIRPVQVQARVTNATIYNSATGELELLASNGTTGIYTYQWDDQVGPGNPLRPTLIGPRTYGCLVRDQSGASTYVSVPVGADPRLEVLATTTDTSITLLITGGLPPYTVLWDDGATTVVRTGLAPTVYRAVVTDSRGAVQDVVVDLNRQSFYWSRNAILLPLDAGAAYRLDPTTKPNLSFLCEVWLELDYLSNTFVQIGTTLEQPGDRDGRTTFNVQALLDAFLQPHVPAPNATTPARAESLFKRFYLRHREQFGRPAVPGAATTQDYRYVVQGGLSFYEASARTWFSSYQRRQLPFLSWEPTTKPVYDDQPEYLYYMVQGSPLEARAFLRVGFDTGQAQVIPLWQDLTSLANAEVYCLPVGYQALGLAGFAGLNLTIAWWEVWVATPDGL